MLLPIWQGTWLLHFGCDCFFHSVFLDFPFFVTALNGHSRDFVDGCSFSRSGSLSSSGATRVFIRCCKRPLDNHSCWWYRWFVGLVSVAFVAHVRKDALDHVIWTSAVVPRPVVTDCHHRLQLLLFHSQQEVKELGAILV